MILFITAAVKTSNLTENMCPTRDEDIRFGFTV
jgi:hypothetical protein